MPLWSYPSQWNDIENHRKQRKKRVRGLLKRLPRRASLHRYPGLKWAAQWAKQAPWLWSFKRWPVLGAVYLGSILSLLPLFGVQLPLAMAIAYLCRVNLTLTVALQFITNPFTIVPIYAGTAWVGHHWLLMLGKTADPSPLWYTQCLVTGGVITGLAVGLLVHLMWLGIAWEWQRFQQHHYHVQQKNKNQTTNIVASAEPSKSRKSQ